MYHYKLKKENNGKWRIYWRTLLRYKLIDSIEYNSLADAITAYEQHMDSLTGVLHIEG